MNKSLFRSTTIYLLSAKCECIKPYVNAAPKDKLPGSVCRLDYCSDVNFCPSNTTCKNAEDQPQDVDECALGLHNCSAAAICTDLHIGYKCTCAEGVSTSTYLPL
uniref:EGF-like domain-containing protein n=1 Tax=Parascaris equorum TaxID=6256 RepID=A0A914R675_PAREQ